MRSRFSAYCLNDWAYILKTYASSQRNTLSEDDLKESAAGTKWLSLLVVPPSVSDSPLSSQHERVEFKAFYAIQNKLYLMHETSEFIVEDGEWRYTTGVIHNDTGQIKSGRNDPCICGSGKKFKQCCLKKL